MKKVLILILLSNLASAMKTENNERILSEIDGGFQKFSSSDPKQIVNRVSSVLNAEDKCVSLDGIDYQLVSCEKQVVAGLIFHLNIKVKCWECLIQVYEDIKAKVSLSLGYKPRVHCPMPFGKMPLEPFQDDELLQKQATAKTLKTPSTIFQGSHREPSRQKRSSSLSIQPCELPPYRQ